MRVLVVVGTRPEIIKMAPVVSELQKRGIFFDVAWTAQNVQRYMGAELLEEFGYDLLRVERFDGLSVEALARRMSSVDVVLVEGDTTSATVAATAAVHTKVTLGHVEAGLRSGDMRMREERNRRAIDAMSDMLFCPLPEHGKECSLTCLGQVRVVGNTIADVLAELVQEGVVPEKKKQIVVTLHRPELVDFPDRLDQALQALAMFAERKELKVVFPVHPRTADKLCEKYVGVLAKFETMPPVSARTMWKLIMESQYVVTDSGGIQEEACILGTPCFTFRPNTERPETICCGANALVRPGPAQFMFGQMLGGVHEPSWTHPYGSNVAKKIVDVLEGF